jgi:hypothetical protein
LHSINSPRRFRNGWRSTQNDDPAGHPHRVRLTLGEEGFQNVSEECGATAGFQKS